MPRTPRPPERAGSPTPEAGPGPAYAAMAAPIGCSDAASSAPTSRTASAAPDHRRARSSRPVVTVPVLSSTTVSTRRVDSSTSGPLITMPSCAARPVPASSAVGRGQAERARAGDDEHGDRGGERVRGRVAEQQPHRERHRGQREHDRHEHRRHPVGQPLHRRLAGLRPLDQRGDLGQRGVARRPGWPARPAGPPPLTVAPATVAPGATSTGTDSPVSIDASTVETPVEHHAVGRDLLARTDHELVADGQLGDRHLDLDAVDAAPARSWRRVRAAPAARRRTPAAPAPPACVRAAGRRRPSTRPRSSDRPPVNSDDRRPRPRGDDADADQRVHRRAQPCRALISAARWNGHAP